MKRNRDLLARCGALCVLVMSLAGTAPAQSADSGWRIVDETRFVTRRQQFGPYYELNQDYRPSYDDDAVLPEEALQINSSQVNDCWIQLARGVPWRVKWEIEVLALTNTVVLVPESDGIVFEGRKQGRDGAAEPGLPMKEVWQKVVMVREGDSLTVSIDGRVESITFVDAQKRVPLRMTVKMRPRVWVRDATLSITPGGAWDWHAADEMAVPQDAVEWEEVYRQDFSSAGSMDDFVLVDTNAKAFWLPEDGCVRLKARHQLPGENVHFWLQRELPGDLRIRFRARNAPNEDHFFGLFISCKDGDFAAMDGYFCEWNRGWMRRIKKKGAQRAIVRPHEEQISTPTWIDFRLERIGPKIALYKDGRESLSWIDPDPTDDLEYGSFAFYSWRMQIDIDDLVIDQNVRQLEERARLAGLQAPAESTKRGRAGAANVAESAGTQSAGIPADTVFLRETGLDEADAALPPAPRLVDIFKSGGLISFRWESDPRYVYEVQSCNSLLGAPTWKAIAGWERFSTAEEFAVFTTPISTEGHAFYRVVARFADNAGGQ